MTLKIAPDPERATWCSRCGPTEPMDEGRCLHCDSTLIAPDVLATFVEAERRFLASVIYGEASHYPHLSETWRGLRWGGGLVLSPEVALPPKETAPKPSEFARAAASAEDLT